MIFGDKCSKATVEIRSSTITIFKKTNQKVHALARLPTFIDPINLEILLSSVIKSHFHYCPLVWMFHDRVLNSKLNLIQERVLRLVCKGIETECEKLTFKL